MKFLLYFPNSINKEIPFIIVNTDLIYPNMSKLEEDIRRKMIRLTEIAYEQCGMNADSFDSYQLNFIEHYVVIILPRMRYCGDLGKFCQIVESTFSQKAVTKTELEQYKIIIPLNIIPSGDEKNIHRRKMVKFVDRISKEGNNTNNEPMEIDDKNLEYSKTKSIFTPELSSHSITMWVCILLIVMALIFGLVISD